MVARMGLLILTILLSPISSWALTVVVGSYTGNGADDRNIVISPACQPVAVFVQRANSAWGGQVMLSSMSTNSSSEFTGAIAGQSNRIQQINADGFQVGTIDYVNLNGSPYRYAALCDNGLSDVAVGSFTGNGADDRDIVISPAFQPELVIIFPASSAVVPWRGATSHSGDSASSTNAALADVANYIQAFNADGFEVGTFANANAVVHHYLAIKGNAAGVATGNYAGNTSDGRDITVGFEPKFVLIKGNSTGAKTAHRFANSGDNSFCGDAAEASNIIQALGATTFQVGTNTCSNQNAITMRWLALTDVDPPSGHPAMRRWGGIYGMGSNLTGRGGF